MPELDQPLRLGLEHYLLNIQPSFRCFQLSLPTEHSQSSREQYKQRRWLFNASLVPLERIL